MNTSAPLPQTVVPLHSACCGYNWCLFHFQGGVYQLRCAKCGKPAGSDVVVSGPDLAKSLGSKKDEVAN